MTGDELRDKLTQAIYGYEMNYRTAARIVDLVLMPVIREALADAWTDGYDAGHEFARAVNPEWPEAPSNPWRQT